MQRVYKKTVVVLGDIAAVLIALIFLVVIAEVLSRNLFRQSLPAAFEIGVFLLVYAAFFGAAAAFGRNAHFKVFDAQNRLPDPFGRISQVLADSIAIVFLGIVGYFGVQLALSQMDQPSAALQIPYGIVYLSLPVFAFTSILLLAMRLAMPVDAVTALFADDTTSMGA